MIALASENLLLLGIARQLSYMMKSRHKRTYFNLFMYPVSLSIR